MKLAPTCPYCDREAKLVGGAQVYPKRPDLRQKFFWQCKPCDAYVGCHPHSQRPMGRLADAKLRKAKQAAHAAFDPLWSGGGPSKRREAYTWLAEQLGFAPQNTHIGMFDVATCERVVELCAMREFDAA